MLKVGDVLFVVLRKEFWGLEKGRYESFLCSDLGFVFFVFISFLLCFRRFGNLGF